MSRRRFFPAVFLMAALALCVPAAAEGETIQEVVLCQKEEVSAIDMEYLVGEDVDKISVNILTSGSRDWNYVKEEHRLYIAIASAEKIDLAHPIAEINAGGVPLKLNMLRINGSIVQQPVLTHTPEAISGERPTCEKDGRSEGVICKVCGAVLKEPQVIPATGPTLSAQINQEGHLVLSGAVSDDKVSKGFMLLAVYDKPGKMLTLLDISEQRPDHIEITIPECGNATRIKLFQLTDNLVPRSNPIDVMVCCNAA